MKHIPHLSPKTWPQYLWLVIAFLLYQTQAALAQTSFSYCDASFTYTQKTNVCPPNAHCLLADNVEVSFTAKSPNNQMYKWNFGDGETAKGETVTHRYFKSGKYEVSLSVYSPTVPWGNDGPSCNFFFYV